ncbi:VOC family protein [Mesorhizobium sp. 1B3]|uniref:VOC family protein n=1 Tax=Mesorhizobium sp. 1B3 TaxID=3243599 RepID=UPI003D98EF48
MRLFVPAKDFAQSQDFYRTLGFKVNLASPRMALAALEGGGGSLSFLIQDFYVQDLAENLMLQWIVPDIAPWWERLSSLRLEEVFGVKAAKAPVREPWGTVAYFWDPSGVLWHLTSLNKPSPDSEAA